VTGPALPKFLCPLNHEDVLADVILNGLIQQGVKEVIFATGHLHGLIRSFILSKYKNMFESIHFSSESSPLGTGGAILNSRVVVGNREAFFVINGDTVHGQFLDDISIFSENKNADLVIATTFKELCGDQATVAVDETTWRVLDFNYQGVSKVGHVNSGIYLLRTETLVGFETRKMSFECDIIPNLIRNNKRVFSYPGPEFYDIGTPVRLADFKNLCM